jgi:3-isopropylmalate/(R)-2-methylmalate dehydratase small subunit
MGRLWRFDEAINTDVLAPGIYMKSSLEVLAPHCLEAVRPEFASQVKAGDVFMAGHNMGAGSSREQAAEVLKFLGISCVVAQSFAGIFYRNAINLGLPVFVLPALDRLPSALHDGANVVFDFDGAKLSLPEHKLHIQLDPLPSFLRDLILDGGLVQHLEKRFASSR